MPGGGALEAAEPLLGFAARLRDAAERASDAVPEGLTVELRPYQREGLRWLNALAEAGVGGVLADDMGLGKTLQLITHLLSLKQGGALTQPALIVVPTSLIPNWQSEIARFAPMLQRAGPARAAARRGIRPARRAGHRADQLCAAAARRGDIAQAAVRADRAGRGAAGEEPAHAGAPCAAQPAHAALRLPHRHAAGKPPGRAVVAGRPGRARPARRRRRVPPPLPRCRSRSSTTRNASSG